MKKVIIMSMMLSGCVSYPDYSALQKDYSKPENNPYLEAVQKTVTVSPSVAPDGTVTFGAVGWNKLPEHYPPGQTIKDWHAGLIANELGRQRLCMSGYSYKKVNVSNGMITYRGKCK